MRLVWKALYELSGHALVFAGGVAILAAGLNLIAVKPHIAETVMIANGLKVLLALFGMALIAVGTMSIAASRKLKPDVSTDPDEYELDHFYYLNPRGH